MKFILKIQEPRFLYAGFYCTKPSRTLIFFEPSDNSRQKLFPLTQSNTLILVTPDFSKYPIFRTNFRFPLRFEKFGYNCNSGMIIRSLDVRIGTVFVFTAIWVRLYNTCFWALCNFFRAIRSPPPPPKSKGARTFLTVLHLCSSWWR